MFQILSAKLEDKREIDEVLNINAKNFLINWIFVVVVDSPMN